MDFGRKRFHLENKRKSKIVQYFMAFKKRQLLLANRKNIHPFTINKCIVYFWDLSRIWKTQEYTREMGSGLSIVYDILTQINKQATITITTIESAIMDELRSVMAPYSRRSHPSFRGWGNLFRKINFYTES